MEFSFKMRVNATKEKIWPYYSDIKKWYKWEEDLEDITLNGGFQSGSIGTMKLKGMPALEYTLTQVVENKIFCDKTTTPFGDLYFNHQLLDETDGVYIQHSVCLDTTEITKEKLGFLKQVFADVPDSIMLLKSEVEK